jgi:hypothetical protein
LYEDATPTIPGPLATGLGVISFSIPFELTE